MYFKVYDFGQIFVALKFGLALLVLLYGTSWLVTGSPGFAGAAFHPIFLIAAFVSASCGLIGGAAVVALALIPYAIFDLPVREIEQSFQSHRLEALIWPALASAMVVVLGGLRDLREHKMLMAQRKIAALYSDLEAVQSAAEDALAALKRNEASIAMRSEISSLAVFKAFLKLRDDDGTNFEQDLKRLLWLVSPDAEYAVLTRDGATVSASPGVASKTLALMRKLAKDADDAGRELESSGAYAAEGRIKVACSASGESGLVVCVSSTKETSYEALADYLPEIADVIYVQAKKFVKAHARKPKKRSAA